MTCLPKVKKPQKQFFFCRRGDQELSASQLDHTGGTTALGGLRGAKDIRERFDGPLVIDKRLNCGTSGTR